MSTFYERLIALVRNQKAVFTFQTKEELGSVLAFLLSVMRASENLCESAFDQSYALGYSVFNLELTEFYRLHLEDERGHDKWLERDLREAGLTAPSIPDYLAAAVAGTQYYLLHHFHPVALLGYMVYLEGDPMPLDTLEALEEKFGKSLLRTMRFHAEHDVGHSDDLRDICNLVPPALQPLVEQSLVVTGAYWNTALVRHEVGAGSMNFRRMS